MQYKVLVQYLGMRHTLLVEAHPDTSNMALTHTTLEQWLGRTVKESEIPPEEDCRGDWEIRDTHFRHRRVKGEKVSRFVARGVPYRGETVTFSFEVHPSLGVYVPLPVSGPANSSTPAPENKLLQAAKHVEWLDRTGPSGQRPVGWGEAIVALRSAIFDQEAS